MSTGSLRQLEQNYQPPQAHHHGPGQTLFPQYEDIDQQNETYIVGMWSFLVTEIMFFGALFLAYSVYRTLYPETWHDAHRFLNVFWGTLNTTVLLTSSFSMVMAVYFHQQGKKWGLIGCLLFTVLMSFCFLGIKYIEYTTKINEGLFPGYNWNYSKALAHHEHESGGHGGATAEGQPVGAHGGTTTDGQHTPTQAGSATAEPGGRKESHTEEIASGENVGFDVRPREGLNNNAATVTNDIGVASLDPQATREEARGKRARLFFSIYFTMTGLHGVHVLIGIILMTIIVAMAWMDHPLIQDYMPTEMVGLYWHFVDIVWIFLFPMMYLIS